MLRHLVFADCAALCTDDHMRDVFVGMSYGMYPFCVQEDREGRHLLFRRVALPGDARDRQQRQTEAGEALAALVPGSLSRTGNPRTERPGVPRRPGGRQRAALSAAQQHGPLAHRGGPQCAPGRGSRPVAVDPLGRRPGLDRPLAPRGCQRPHATALRTRVATSASPGRLLPHASQPRHLRLAQILDFVGQRAASEGASAAKCAALCRNTANRFATGQLEVVVDPDSGRLSDVR